MREGGGKEEGRGRECERSVRELRPSCDKSKTMDDPYEVPGAAHSAMQGSNE